MLFADILRAAFLIFQIIKPGYGEEIGTNKIAYIDYFVWLEGNDIPVDNSKSHSVRGRTDQPYRFKVGEGGVLPAIDFAVSTMQPREVAKFLAQPKYAYGILGCPPRIPPSKNYNSCITFKHIICISCCCFMLAICRF